MTVQTMDKCVSMMSISSVCKLIVITILFTASETLGFTSTRKFSGLATKPRTLLVPTPSATSSLSFQSSKQHNGDEKYNTAKTNLHMSFYDNNDNNQRNDFDLSKPTFDLFSFRAIRNDALLQYSSLNQSEPLRINLFLILTVSAFSFPTVSDAVIGENATLVTTALSVVGGIGSFTLFLKECKNRLKQLMRIEKEMNAEYLKLSMSTQNKLNPKLFDNGSANDVETTLKSLRGKNRIVAIYGTTEQLKDELVSFRIFRRRLNQANSIVIPVPTDLDISESKDWWTTFGITETEIRSCQWLAKPQDLALWATYFDNLLDGDESQTKQSNELTWFGLNYNGRSFASGSGTRNGPMLLQILGQNLRPIEILDELDESETLNAANKEVKFEFVEEIQSLQKEFYKALTGGDLDAMSTICSTHMSKEVSEVISAGGRIDDWSKCLAEDARPSNMKISGSDALIVSPKLAYSTCIEFPVVAGGYDSASSFGATLLAVQKWGKDEDNNWKLEYHSTIPWSTDTKAGGMLRCDCRGCIALTRGPERRTFGGIIG